MAVNQLAFHESDRPIDRPPLIGSGDSPDHQEIVKVRRKVRWRREIEHRR